MSDIEKQMTPLEMYMQRPKNLWKRIAIAAVLLVLVIWSADGISFNGIAAKGSEVAYGIVYGLTHPDLDLLFDMSTDGVFYLTAQTIAIAILGTIFGAILAIPVSFLASKNITNKWVAFIFRALILLIRTIPSLVWALVWIRVTGPNAFCGVVTQSVCSIGMISKMYITAIEDLDTGVLDALDASGCTTFQKIRCGILPQLSANFISTTIYRFDINLKDATTLGIVGAGGIGAALVQSINSRRWAMVGSFLLALIILVLIIEYCSTKIRNKLAHGNQ
ncbi:MAG: phosphonate ABC transporter, permease protein PhnE [Solobacterium sp.]|jgi:phosphonate transport system permease protein|nr:phosphonate ABC transporter, permease protein PhnE [Solobacterium sp.]MCH4205413.1 phosphonate ABC transporter, permease protein PhnE [Solobacterium sp.]MCH4226625.1 phosphonate ABC transporter, permease protein PhnE [Solobacterium sp.]MCH4282100.1 phosphonate ABC transporter, permease protein PhnE [Solobacterium sp.]